MILTLDLVAILVAGFMAGNEFAVAVFAHPVLYTMDEPAHAAAAKRLAARLGRAMPFWYAASFLLSATVTFLHWRAPGSLFLGAASFLFAIVIVGTILVLVPINNRIARLSEAAPYRGWLEDRRRWDVLHRLRVIALATAFALLSIGILLSP